MSLCWDLRGMFDDFQAHYPEFQALTEFFPTRKQVVTRRIPKTASTIQTYKNWQ